jgi:hypothetical protein
MIVSLLFLWLDQNNVFRYVGFVSCCCKAFKILASYLVFRDLQSLKISNPILKQDFRSYLRDSCKKIYRNMFRIFKIQKPLSNLIFLTQSLTKTVAIWACCFTLWPTWNTRMIKFVAYLFKIYIMLMGGHVEYYVEDESVDKYIYQNSWSLYTGHIITVQNRTHVYMNFFDRKDLGNHLLQLCPKVVKHPVYMFFFIPIVIL